MSVVHRITVLGRDLSVRSTADEDAVRKVESFVNDRIGLIIESGKASDSQLAIILAFLNVAEEYLSLKEKTKVVGAAADSRISRLIQQLDSVAD